MTPKIFNPLLIIIAMITGLHSYTIAQTVTPEQQNEMEVRMKQMEQKMQNMQARFDSLKKNDSVRFKEKKAYGYGITYATPKAFKVTPRTNKTMPRPPKIAISPIPPQAFKGFGKSLGITISKDFNFEAYDQKLEERVKSGEVKELSKTYSKSYTVNRDDKLVIDNRYGKVTVNTWNKKEFKVDVLIKADALENDEAQRLLDGVTIADSKDGSTISFSTNIVLNDGNSSWGTWTSNGKNYVRRVIINYTIYMPSKNSLQITNRYGGTELPDFDGKLIINSFGNFTAKKLTNADNQISNRGATTIQSLYGSQLKVTYGSLDLESTENLNAQVSFSPVKIGKIKSAATIDVRYGPGIQINDVDKNLKSLSVNTYVAPVSVGFSNNENFNFDVTVRNNSFDYGNHDVTVTSQSPGPETRKYYPTKTYKGYLGKGSADKVITIKSNYAPVKFTLL